MLLIIGYHIKNNSTRTRLHKMLKDFGRPVQNSLFECLLDNEQEKLFVKRIKMFEEKITEGDSIRIYRVCEKCSKKLTIIGAGNRLEEPLYYLA